MTPKSSPHFKIYILITHFSIFVFNIILYNGSVFLFFFFSFLQWVFRAKGGWGLVRGMRQSWLTNGQGWTKAWRGSIWHWLPPDKLTPFISTAIVKLMSYVCNRLQWLEKTVLRESVALIWIGSDSWKELSISTVSTLGKVVYLCFSWQQQQFVCWVYRSETEPYTNNNDQTGRTLKHISAGTEN